jgi:hypothetical protein
VWKVVAPMGGPQELRIPDHVPDELVERYGTVPSPHPGDPGLSSTQRTGARSGTWLLRLALAGCLAVVAGILVALVAAAPLPAAAAVGLLVVMLVAAGGGLTVTQLLLRAGDAGRARRARSR